MPETQEQGEGVTITPEIFAVTQFFAEVSVEELNLILEVLQEANLPSAEAKLWGGQFQLRVRGARDQLQN